MPFLNIPKRFIDEAAWEAFTPTSHAHYEALLGRIAVKVINHLGDEVMKVCAL
jgi:adenine-specific DNA-methyltransferase